MRRRAIALTILSFLLAGPVVAKVTLQRLAEDRYQITHRNTTYIGGGGGKAMRFTNEEAASLCVLVGYSWFEILDRHTKGRGWTNAQATVDVKLYKEKKDEDSIECEPLATQEAKDRIAKRLKKIGVKTKG